MASLSDIAKHAGVSKSTVSLVLNNKSSVSARMRDRVLKAAAELDPRMAGGGDARGSKPNVLLIHPMSMGSHQVFRELLQGVRASVVDEAGGNLSLAVHDPPLKPDHATSALIHDPLLRPDAAIVMAPSTGDPIFAELRSERLPCVLLARQRAPDGISCVGMDNVAGAEMAVRHLLGLGHRRIAFAGGDPAYEYAELRLEGYLRSMEKAGLSPAYRFGSGAEAVKGLIEGTPDPDSWPTAIVFVNDEHAAAGISELAKVGLRVPDDVSAIGFDDTENATGCVPTLSTVRVPRYLIGKLAGRTALDHIALPDLDRVSIILGTSLSLRNSAAPPRTSSPRSGS